MDAYKMIEMKEIFVFWQENEQNYSNVSEVSKRFDY